MASDAAPGPDAVSDASVQTDAEVPVGTFLETMTAWDENSFSTLTLTHDGNLVVAGYTGRVQTFPYYAGLIAKFTPQGTLVWSHMLTTCSGGTLYPNRVIELSDHGFVVVGYGPATGILSGGDDAVVLRFDEDGSLLWSRFFGRNYYDAFTDMVEMPDGGLLLAGQNYTGEPATSVSIWLVRLSPQGDVMWQKAADMDSSEEGPRIARFPSGDYLVVGTTQTDANDDDTVDAMLLRVTQDGELRWARRLGGPGSESISGIAGAMGENLLLGMYSSLGGSGEPRPWLVSVQPNGDIAWAVTFAGPTEPSYFEDLGVVEDGLVVAVGDGLDGATGESCSWVRWIRLTEGMGHVEQWDGPVHPFYQSGSLMSVSAFDMSHVAVCGQMYPVDPRPGVNDVHALVGVVGRPEPNGECSAFHLDEAPPTIERHSPQSSEASPGWGEADVPTIPCEIQQSVPTIEPKDLCQ